VSCGSLPFLDTSEALVTHNDTSAVRLNIWPEVNSIDSNARKITAIYEEFETVNTKSILREEFRYSMGNFRCDSYGVGPLPDLVRALPL
jgi:hypothetical protein